MSEVQPVPARAGRNPWMIALTVIWVGLALLAFVFVVLSGQVGSQGFDSPGMPPSDELAGIYLAVSGVMAGLAVVVVAVQLGVGALIWHLDPASRAIVREAAAAAPRPARQDF